MDTTVTPFGLSREAAQASITTRRLFLRLPLGGDIPALSRLVSDPVIAGFTAQIPYPYSPIEARRFVDFCGADTGPHLAAHFLLTLRANPKLAVGGAGFTWMAGHIPEIGYWIASPYRRRGFAGEAVHALLRRLFTQSVAQTVQAWVHADNTPSLRVLRRAGFKRIGSGVRHSRAQGRRVPAIRFGLDRNAWAKRSETAAPSADTDL
jgi:RimJ/RimL family protein N-acetyltransferase